MSRRITTQAMRALWTFRICAYSHYICDVAASSSSNHIGEEFRLDVVDRIDRLCAFRHPTIVPALDEEDSTYNNFGVRLSDLPTLQAATGDDRFTKRLSTVVRPYFTNAGQCIAWLNALGIAHSHDCFQCVKLDILATVLTVMEARMDTTSLLLQSLALLQDVEHYTG